MTMNMFKKTKSGYDLSFVKKSEIVQKSLNNSHKQLYRAQYEVENFIEDFSSVHYNRNMGYSDPTITGFKIYWHFDSPVGLLADENNVNSALAYLKRIGDSVRYEMLHRFIVLLSEVSVESPWVFKNISGLDEVFKENFHNVVRNHQITIETYETLDQRVMSLIQLYRNVLYDFDRGCYVLPANLRRFSMSVYVYDTRTFHNVNGLQESKFPLRQFNLHQPQKLFHNVFDLGYCTIDNESGAEFFSAVSNTDNEFSHNKLIIKCEKAAMSNLLLQLDDTAFTELYNISTGAFNAEIPESKNSDDNSFQSKFRKYKSKLYNRMKKHVMNEIPIVRGVNEMYENLLQDTSWTTKVIEHVGTVAAKTLIDAAFKKLNSMYLGNVYGFGVDDIAIMRTGNPLAINTRRKIHESTTQSLSGGTKYRNLGNVNE